jgi:subtilisin family serine protease
MRSFSDLLAFLRRAYAQSRPVERRDKKNRRHFGMEDGLEPRQLLTFDLKSVLYAPQAADRITLATTAQEYVVSFSKSQSTSKLATSLGASSVTKSPYLTNGYIVKFSGKVNVTTTAEKLSKLSNFQYVHPNLPTKMTKYAVPNDTLFGNQWHLLNSGQGGGLAGIDANVTDVWDNFTGDGVTILISDDGVELTHPDLIQNIGAAGLHYDYVSNDTNPSPGNAGDSHGTSVAGVAAGRGGNGLGISGAAPDAEIAAIRLIAGTALSDTTLAAAALHQSQIVDVSNNSWGSTAFLSTMGPQETAAYQIGATTGRGGLGVVYVFAAGNSRTREDNVNYHGQQSSRYTIAVGAIANSGRVSSYSTPGAAVLVSAPSNGGSLGITTTDLTGDAGANATGTGDGDGLADTNYTSVFGGTSSAAPLVSGVIALVLEANPNLTWLEVQDILVKTSRQVNPGDSSWSFNGAGRAFSPDYGFGMVDAEAAVNLALNYTRLRPEMTATLSRTSINQTIRDNSSTATRQVIPISTTMRMTHAELTLNATHARRGDLEVTLVSPSGTRSVLAEDRTLDTGADYSDWKFTSVQFWDESSEGDWTIEIRDRRADTAGTLNSFTLQLYGTNPDIPVPSQPTLLTPSGTIADVLPAYSWTAATDAATYEIEVSRTGTGIITSRSGITGLSFIQPTRLTEGNYSVRVRAVNSELEVGPWSTARSFTVNVPTPARPVIVSPKGTIGNSYPTFEWTSSQNAVSYNLTVINTATNQRVIYRTDYSGLTYSHFSELKDGTYIVSVQAKNSVGELSDPSDAVVFTVDSPVPATPRLTAPARTTTSTNPRFVWTAVSGVARYELAVNNLSTGKKDYIREKNLPRTSTFFDPKYFTQGNYVAYIRAINGNGEASPWSPKYSFTVDVLPPDRPVVTGPRGANNSSTVTTTNPTFSWTSVPRAVKYDLWVNNLTTKKSQVIRQKNLTTTSYTPVGNMDQGKYRVYVRGINVANEVGEWSKLLDFTIDEPTPARPVIVAPVASALGFVDNANPTFVWTANPAAPFYEFQLQNVSLNKQAISVKGLTKPQYTVPTSLRLGEYSYSARVRSVNVSGDVSSWSEAYTIRIDVPAPTTPRLIGPGNSSRDTTPTFTWVHGGSATRYEILVRDLVRNEQITLQVKTFQLSPDGNTATYTLPNSRALVPSTYRFWVRAFNSTNQASGWSTSKTFVILASADSGLQDNSESADAGLLLLTNAVTDSPEVDSEPDVRRMTYVDIATESDASVVPAKSSGVYETTVYEPSVAVDETEDLALIDAIMNRLADPSGDLDLSRHQS